MSDKQIARYEKIEALRKTGMTVAQACKKAKTTSTSFYNWRGKMKPKKAAKSRLTVIDLPQVQRTGRGFIVFGSPSELAEFARVYQ
jgi:hypothetical protein